MERLLSWSFGDHVATFHFHYSQFHSVSVRYAGQIEMFSHFLLLWFYSLRIFLISDCLSQSLSDSKSIQVSRTFLSILANFNNAVILIVLICPRFSNSSSPVSKPLRTIPSMPIQQVSPLPTCSTACLILWLDSSTCHSFHFLWFLLCGPTGRQVFFFFFLLTITRSSGRD